MNKAELLAELQELKQDKPFGILTRPGLEIEHRKQAAGTYVIFMDLDQIHDLNSAIGAEAVNRKIRRALKIRHEDLILSGRWFSGDELAFIVKGDPRGVSERLLQSLNKNGLSATIAFAPLGDLEKAVNKAKKRVEASKKINARGLILR